MLAASIYSERVVCQGWFAEHEGLTPVLLSQKPPLCNFMSVITCMVHRAAPLEEDCSIWTTRQGSRSTQYTISFTTAQAHRIRVKCHAGIVASPLSGEGLERLVWNLQVDPCKRPYHKQKRAQVYPQAEKQLLLCASVFNDSCYITTAPAAPLLLFVVYCNYKDDD